MLSSRVLIATILVTLAISSSNAELLGQSPSEKSERKAAKKLAKQQEKAAKKAEAAFEASKKPDDDGPELIIDYQGEDNELKRDQEDEKAMEEAIKSALEELAQRKRAEKQAKEAAISAKGASAKKDKKEKAKKGGKKEKKEKKGKKQQQEQVAEKKAEKEQETDDFLQTDQQHEYEQDLQAEYAQESRLSQRRQQQQEEEDSSSSGYYYESPYPQGQGRFRQPQPYRPFAWPEPFRPKSAEVPQQKSMDQGGIIGGQALPLQPILTEEQNDPFGKLIDMKELAGQMSAKRNGNNPWEDVEARKQWSQAVLAERQRQISEMKRIRQEMKPQSDLWNNIKKRM